MFYGSSLYGSSLYGSSYKGVREVLLLKEMHRMRPGGGEEDRVVDMGHTEASF